MKKVKIDSLIKEEKMAEIENAVDFSLQLYNAISSICSERGKTREEMIDAIISLILQFYKEECEGHEGTSVVSDAIFEAMYRANYVFKILACHYAKEPSDEMKGVDENTAVEEIEKASSLILQYSKIIVHLSRLSIGQIMCVIASLAADYIMMIHEQSGQSYDELIDALHGGLKLYIEDYECEENKNEE